MPFPFNLNDVADDDDRCCSHPDDDSNGTDGPQVGDREPITQKKPEGGRKRPRKDKASSETRKELKQQAGSQPKHKTPSKENKNALLVGVDIGTTFSGASYQSNHDTSGNQIHTIMNWPSSEKSGQYLSKMPSKIAYRDENQAWGPEKRRLSRDVIGYEVKPGMKSYTWFKLLLDEKADPTDYDDPNLHSAVGEGAFRLPAGKTAVDVVSDFLRIFKGILMKELAARMTSEVLEALPIHFWVTVPAIWDDRAQTLMIDALRKAGFFDRPEDQVRTVTEPEAAAVAALKLCHEQSATLVKRNLRALIVDLGGGTVDLECVRTDKVSPLAMSIIGVGNGGKCGSTTIDRNFIAYMRDTFGDSYEVIAEAKRGPGSAFLNAFEAEKRGFQGDSEESCRIPFPALAQQLSRHETCPDSFDREEGELVITSNQMAIFFDDTIKRVCKLIVRQVARVQEIEKSDPDVIILAGGLSCSEYVFKSIQAFCRNELKSSIQLLRPENAWGAISFGAVAFGLDSTVMVSRVSRRHYFIAAQRAFREGFDPEERAVQCPIYGKRVKDELQPLLKKGERTTTSAKYLRGYVLVTSVKPEDLQYTLDIICNNADEPPQWEGDPGNYVVNRLHIDLRPVVKVWAKEGWSGLNHNFANKPVKVSFNVVVKGGDGAGVIHVQANANKINVGSTTMDYST